MPLWCKLLSEHCILGLVKGMGTNNPSSPGLNFLIGFWCAPCRHLVWLRRLDNLIVGAKRLCRCSITLVIVDVGIPIAKEALRYLSTCLLNREGRHQFFVLCQLWPRRNK